MEARRRIPTGSKSLDAQLLGGIPTSELTLVYGEPGTGKTTLAVSAAAQLILVDPAARIVYVDSDAKFTPTRLTQIAGTDQQLRQLSYIRPTTFEEQSEAIDHLPEQLQPGDLAIIDSVTGLYRVETGDTQKTFAENKELNRHLGLLKEIAATTRTAVMMTGQVRSVFDSPIPAVEPVAQRLLRYWSDKVIKVENTPTPGVKQAAVEKPPEMRGASRFRITQGGLEDQ